MRQIFIVLIGFTVVTGCSGLSAQEESLSATIQRVTSQGVTDTVGTIRFEDSPYGLIVTPNLDGLSPGLLGTHVHQNPSCMPGQDGTPGGGAGGHYDPAGTDRHLGPYRDGHLGDLPNLMAEQDGTAVVPVLAPRVSLSDLQGRSLILHANKDDYGNNPGGSRAYCGVIR